MSLQDSINYILFQNPVSSTIVSSVTSVTKLGSGLIFKGKPTQVAQLPPALENLPVSRVVLSGNPFLRLAGVSGAAAVILGAYGAHSIYVKTGYEEQKRIYQIANNYHFLNSLALLGVPLSSHPMITGSLLTLGLVIFCGTCYYDAFTGKTELRKLTPIGGTFLIFGWLGFLF